MQVSSDRGRQPVSDQFVVRVKSDKPRSGYGRGYTRTDHDGRNNTTVISAVQCPTLSSITTATLVLDGDHEALTGRQRIQLIRDLATVFQLPTSLFRLRSPPNDRPLMDVSTALAAGPGDLGAARPHHPGLLVEWDVGCGNVRSELMGSLELLETAAGDGRLRLAVSHPVVGWYVTNNRQRGRRDHKQTAAWPPHPTATPLLPTAVRPTERPDLPTTTVSVVEPTATVPSPTERTTVEQVTVADQTTDLAVSTLSSSLSTGSNTTTLVQLVTIL